MVLETRDALDGQLDAFTTPGMTRDVEMTKLHPLTGPGGIKASFKAC
ncbi:MAG TPA: hypothetical protein VFX41_00960 [Actinomycetales bacterium]|nr:hypothetical protein [Actinomycetales bacterium]